MELRIRFIISEMKSKREVMIRIRSVEKLFSFFLWSEDGRHHFCQTICSGYLRSSDKRHHAQLKEKARRLEIDQIRRIRRTAVDLLYILPLSKNNMKIASSLAS